MKSWIGFGAFVGVAAGSPRIVLAKPSRVGTSRTIKHIAAGALLAMDCSVQVYLPWPAAATEQTLPIAIKSYIARMGPPADQRTTPPSDSTKKALGFEGETMNRNHALFFMYKTDDAFSEDPKTPGPENADYRLWSSVTITGTCDLQGNLSAWYVSAAGTKFGKEGSLEAVGQLMSPLVVTANGHPVATSVASRGPAMQSVALAYAVKGRPNDLSIPAFTLIRPRACSWIWHKVAATVSCAGGKLKTSATISRSAFPSVRVWVGSALTQTIAQGPFEDLWACDDGDHTLVR